MQKINFGGLLKEAGPTRKPVRWTAVGIAALILFYTGVSLFHVPEYELLYTASRIEVPVEETGDTFVSYFVEIGNTGRLPHETVRIKLAKTAMDRSVLPVTVKNHGVSSRPFTLTMENDVAVIGLHDLEPEKRVKITFLFRYAEGEVPETWDRIFLGMEIPRGAVKHGDPAMTMVGRAWFRFADLLPF